MLKVWGVMLAVAVTLSVAVSHGQEVPEATAEDYVLGPEEARVTIIEYASLTCPHCAHFHGETLPRVKAEWIEPGRARLVFRDFPLDKLAFLAAMLARCAGRERYFDLLGDVFAQQDQWLAAPDQPAALMAIGARHGMSDGAVRACWVDNEIGNKVAESGFIGEKKYGVDSTPTFFINGVKFEGDQGYAAFAASLEAAEASRP
jgi:protein-disulfide isomerase